MNGILVADLKAAATLQNVTQEQHF